jgi:hypothetical protein
VRLREPAARALAELGGAAAQAALFSALANERYESARTTEAEALIKLGDKRVVAQIERFLGMETSIPGGVRMLLELGALRAPSAHGASLLSAAARRGTFECDAQGCVPGAEASLVLKASTNARKERITLLISSNEPGASLVVGGTTYRSAGGEQQLSFPRSAALRELPVVSDGHVRIIAWVSVAELPEIPPPAPEPWDAGLSRDAGSEADVNAAR